MSMEKVINCISRHKVFVVTTHQNLEGDALGSQIGFYNLLRRLGKKALMVNQDPTPREYSFISDSRLIIPYRHKMKLKFDCLAMLDCSDKYRSGSVADLIKPDITVLNIDHHISNDRFGDINWVVPDASSASEMVYRLYKKMRVRIDIRAALALYVGILTDTGSFRYVNTSSFTHQAAAELLKFNLNVRKIYRSIYESMRFSDMSLLPRLLITMGRQASGKIIIFKITQRLLKGKLLGSDLTENILNFGRSIAGSEVCVLFKEQPGNAGQVRVNLRSQGEVDVNRIAQFFGGGGHKTASGCTISGSLQAVKQKVIRKIKEQL
ncbi:bifunctional oligoribonuclease/PAP phosphatase NrnA [Candidatus Omnitrophota bacterium]